MKYSNKQLTKLAAAFSCELKGLNSHIVEQRKCYFIINAALGLVIVNDGVRLSGGKSLESTKHVTLHFGVSADELAALNSRRSEISNKQKWKLSLFILFVFLISNIPHWSSSCWCKQKMQDSGMVCKMELKPKPKHLFCWVVGLLVSFVVFTLQLESGTWFHFLRTKDKYDLKNKRVRATIFLVFSQSSAHII